MEEILKEKFSSDYENVQMPIIKKVSFVVPGLTRNPVLPYI